jgi:ribosomal protein S16
MNKKLLLTIVVAILTLVFSKTYADVEKQIQKGRHETRKSLLDLLDAKCTKCHDAARAKKLHETGKKPLDVVKKMQKKEGAEISDAEAIDIAKFLEGPQFLLLQSECTKCHTIETIVNTCRRKPVTKETIKKMQKRGAKITDEQVDIIFEMLSKIERHKKHVTLLGIFSNKCTECHDATRAQKLHETAKKPKDVVEAMQKKKGADISDEEAIDIAKFLEAPFWLEPLFKGECTKCHSVDKIIETCKKGDPASTEISKETIKKMQKKGAKITDEQVDLMYEMLNK